MSFKSKKMIASVAAATGLIIAYIVYALGDKAPATDNLKAWALAMLVFIGISVVVMIVIQILFHITFAIGIAVKEGEMDKKNLRRLFDSETVEDERDKLVELKSARIGHIVAGAGFIAALIALLTGAPALWAIHILFGSFFIGSGAEGIAGVCQYERGVKNG